MSEQTPTAEYDALAKALYQMNGHAWYGRDLGDWDDPESRIGRNSAERDRWYRQADALLVVERSPHRDCVDADRKAPVASMCVCGHWWWRHQDCGLSPECLDCETQID